jgi:large subunit ribosomal protein L18e
MAKRTGPTNVYMRKLVTELRKAAKKENAPIWEDVAEKLAKPSRQQAEVNLSGINRHAAKGETVVVPGVVLGDGKLDKPVNVAAWRFSFAAIEKITKAKGKAMTIMELVEKNPKGSKVRIMV